MENIARRSSALILVVFATMQFVANENVGAQGRKLGRAKLAVHGQAESRSNESKLPTREERHSSNDDHDSHDESDHSHRPERNRGRSREGHHHDSGLSLFFHSRPVTSYSVAPPVYVCPLGVPAPIVVHEPIPVPSIYETVVVESDSLPIVDEPIIIDGPQEIGLDWFDTDRSKFWATAGSDFDGITSGGIGLLLQAPASFGLDASVTMLRESSGDYRDHLWVGDVNVVYEVLSRGDLRGRVGVGVNWLSDSWGSDSGFNLTAGLDLRLTNRLTLSAEGDVGNLGDAAFLHGRVSLSRRFETCELMLGADHFDFGGAQVNSVFTGIQVRF